MAENVGGFAFSDEDLAHLAGKEVEGVAYVRSKVDMNNPAAVLAVYQKMIRGRMFQTQVGIAYLYELQTFLKNCPDIDSRSVIPIPVSANVEVTESPAEVRKLENEIAGLKKKLSAAVAGLAIFFVVIIAMLIIAGSSGSVTIINYENSILDKYSEWEQELTEREKAVSLAEKDLSRITDEE